MNIVTKTPGKLILIGEYAVLEGAAAAVMAVNKFVRITIQKAKDTKFYLTAPNLGMRDLKFVINEAKHIKYFSDLSDTEKNYLKLFEKIFISVYRFLQNKKEKIPFCNITIDSSEFYSDHVAAKFGLGSSAAMTVGLVDAMFKFSGNKLVKKKKLFQHAMQAHLEAQGKMGSGIDIAASTYQGAGIYSKSGNDYIYKNIRIPDDLIIIPIWTGSSTSTVKFVEKTKRFKQNNHQRYNNLMSQLIEISNAGSHYLTISDTKNFLKSTSLYYKLLLDFGLSAEIPIISEIHREIAYIVEKCNGYYKPSGAGGSDIGIALTNDPEIQKNIVTQINNSKFKHIDLDVTHSIN